MQWHNIEFIDHTEAQKRKKAPVLFIALAALVTVLFVGFVASKIMTAVTKIPEPVYADILPKTATVAGTTATKASWLAGTPAVPQSGTLISYALADKQYLALVHWDADDKKYKILGEVALTVGEEKLGPVQSIEPQLISSQQTEIYKINTAKNVFLITINDGIVRALRKILKDGQTVSAVFENLEVQDVDGDGEKEIVTRNKTNTSEVFRFRNNIFIYDTDLSIAMSVRKSLFPEP